MKSCRNEKGLIQSTGEMQQGWKRWKDTTMKDWRRQARWQNTLTFELIKYVLMLHLWLITKLKHCIYISFYFYKMCDSREGWTRERHKKYLDSSTVCFNVDDISLFHSLFLKTLINTRVELRKQDKTFSCKKQLLNNWSVLGTTMV